MLGVAFLSLLSQVTTTQAKDVGNCPPKPLASIDLTVNGPVLVPVTLQGQPAWGPEPRSASLGEGVQSPPGTDEKRGIGTLATIVVGVD